MPSGHNFDLFFFEIYFYFMYGCFAFMDVWVLCVCRTGRGQQGALNPLELEFQIFVRHCVVAGI